MAQAINVAVIGGGCAGLAAAANLAPRDINVTVFESAKQLGGRARGFDYQGLRLDNGQHIMLGAYRETLRLLALAGLDERKVFMRLPLQLHMQDITRRHSIDLQACNWLPAPLHILCGFLSARGLSLSSKLAAMRFMTWAQLNRFKLASDLPLRTFLIQQKQTSQLITSIWEPLCLAALNTPIAEASTQVFLNVLRDSFSGTKSDSDMLLPQVDLSALLAQPLADWLKRQSVNIIQQSVKKIELSSSGFNVFTDAHTYDFNHVILACGPHQLKHIELPDKVASALPIFEYMPITTVYLQFEAHIQLPRPMVGLVNSVSQWVLDRGKMCSQNGLLAVVISADIAASGMSNAQLAEKVIAELQQAFPDLAVPLWYKVITEKYATFACTSKLSRPSHLTPCAGLYLAGDYTYADYPATIEGAVRSGIDVSNYIVNH